MSKKPIREQGPSASLASRAPGKWTVVGHDERGNGLRRANIVFDGVGEQIPASDVLPEVADAVAMFRAHNETWASLERLRTMLSRSTVQLANTRQTEASSQSRFNTDPTEDHQEHFRAAAAEATDVQTRVDAQTRRASELWDICHTELASQTGAAAGRAHTEAREVNLAAVAELSRLAAVTLDLLSVSKLRMEAAARRGASGEGFEREMVKLLGERPELPSDRAAAVVDDHPTQTPCGCFAPRQHVAEGSQTGLGAV